MARMNNFDPTIKPHPYLDDTYMVPLGNGGHALVEGDDVCRVDEYSWHKQKHHSMTGVWHVATTVKSGDGKRQGARMSRLLFGLSKGDRTQVDHVNHDGLDNRRKANLRLSTATQNTTNRRKFRNSSSEYKGVSWSVKKLPWQASISVKVFGRRRTIHLGGFAIEEEAAFAFLVAAPLMLDPDYLCSTPIPAERMPTAKRCSEIKSATIHRIKARLSERKGSPSVTSPYHGVSIDRKDGRWQAIVRSDQRAFYLGRYASEIEAAFACDCAVDPLRISVRNADRVSPESLESPEVAERIASQVARRIAAKLEPFVDANEVAKPH